jgi:hypothetical protein
LILFQDNGDPLSRLNAAALLAVHNALLSEDTGEAGLDNAKWQKTFDRIYRINRKTI